MTGTATRIRRTLLAAALLTGSVALAGCGGTSSGSHGGQPSGESPAAATAKAKQFFDKAASITLDLSTSSQPTSGSAVLGAHGVLTHAPAFKGDVSVFLLGTRANVPVVAVGGKVYAKLPLTTAFAAIDPTQYGAPDPAQFVDPQHGISTLLTEMTGLKATGQTRDGSTVLNTFSGSVPGAKVAPIIPSAKAGTNYVTTLGLDNQDHLITLHVTGAFFGNQAVTYDLALTYGAAVKITAP